MGAWTQIFPHDNEIRVAAERNTLVEKAVLFGAVVPVRSGSAPLSKRIRSPPLLMCMAQECPSKEDKWSDNVFKIDELSAPTAAWELDMM